MTRVERERLRSLRVRSALHFRRFLARADANDILCPVRPSRDKAAEQTKRHHIMHCTIMAYVALFIAILAIFLPTGNADFLRHHKKKELPCVSCRHAVTEIELCAPPNTLPPSWECASLVYALHPPPLIRLAPFQCLIVTVTLNNKRLRT